MKNCKYIAGVLIVSLFLSIFPPFTALAADSIENNANGTVQIKFNNDSESTVLILVENTAEESNRQRYYYKLSEGNNTVDVPLTEGLGTYKLRICRVRSDGKAVVLMTKEIELTKQDAKTVFEVSNVVVKYQVKDEFIKKAQSLTKGCKNDLAKIKKIYNYMVKNFAYDYELLEVKASTSYYNPNNLSTFERKLGICYDISSLAAAMLRSVGVEAKVVTGHTPNVKEYHAWNRVYDSKKKKWYTLDITYDMCLYNAKSKKKYSMIKPEKDYSDITYTY